MNTEVEVKMQKKGKNEKGEKEKKGPPEK